MDPDKQVVYENKGVSDNTWALTTLKEEEYSFCFVDKTIDGKLSIYYFNIGRVYSRIPLPTKSRELYLRD
jgi:hypothetical protein